MNLPKIFLLCSALCSVCSLSGRTVVDFFIAADLQVTPLLSTSIKQDMLDYFNYGSDRATTNMMYGSSKITALTDKQIKYELTEYVTAEMTMLVNGNDTILAVITTIPTPAADSRIDFFSADLQPLSKPLVTLPSYSQWWITHDLSDGNDPEQVVPFVPASATIDTEANTLTITNNAPEMLASDTRRCVEAAMHHTFIYDISGTKFKKRK